MTEPDAQSLLWQPRPVPSRGRRPSLTVPGIVAEAIALADAEGLAGASMPRLAERLGCGVMTLYRYVPGKEELLALMVDAAIAEPPALDDTDWRAACRAWALAFRRVCHEHRWWLGVSLRDRVTGPNETAWLEAELTALAPLRLDAITAMNVALAISGYVRGAVLPELGTEASPRMSFAAYPEARRRFPRVAAVHDAPEFESGEGLRDFFEFGLARLLDGIAAAFVTDGDETEPGY